MGWMLPDTVDIDGDLGVQECDALLVGTLVGSEGIVSRALQELEPSLGDSLGGFMGSTGYRARLGEVRTVATFGRLPSRAIVLIGLGEAKDLTAQELRTALAQVAAEFSGVRRIVSAVHLELQDDALRQASISGLLLGIARRSDSDVRSTSLDTVGGGEDTPACRDQRRGYRPRA